jgi:hypothetical protein
MAQQWEVQSPSGRCSVTARPFAEGDEFYAVLFAEGDTFRRADYSKEAWQGPPEGSFCFFKTRVPVKEKKKRLLVDNDILFSFFLRLSKETEPVRTQFRFVLALILMRKRLLRYEGANVEDGVEVWRMVQPGEQTEHKVINPRLSDQQIDGVSQQLTAILHGDMGEWGVSPTAAADELEPTDE